jgi:uncharacterized protein YjbI with pentapeptide repeats
VGANLIDVDLRDAYLGILSPRARHHGELLPPPRPFGRVGPGANLSGAQLRSVDLSGSTVGQSQLDKACGTHVKLNRGLTIKPCPKL